VGDHRRYDPVVPTKVREAIRVIEEDGWYQVRTRGSHRQFKHPQKPGRVTIAGKPSDDLAPKTLESILRQAGLK
jgi:predicted RNA binding protein YcfA (HicA-like mRNA interferase family)